MTLLLCPYNSDVKAGRLQITSEGKYYTGIKLYENDFNFASDLLKFLRLLGKKKESRLSLLFLSSQDIYC